MKTGLSKSKILMVYLKITNKQHRHGDRDN